MSVVQAVCFYVDRNTLRELVFMSHPSHVFWLASCSSFPIFLKESGSSCFRSSDGCSGNNNVWMTNRAAIFARSIQCSSSAVMVMISLMNPSIDASVDVMSTAKGSSVSRWLAELCFSSCGIKDRCGEFRSSVYQDSYLSRSFPSYISASLTVVYYAGTGVVPMGNLRQRKAGLSNIAMHVDAVVVFACIRR